MPTTIWLPEDIERRLTELAESTQRPQSFYVLEAIERALPELEWEYGAPQRPEEVRAERARAIALEKAIQELGLTD